MRVLMSGASGMLGAAVGNALREHGAMVTKLVRGKAQAPEELRWDPAAEGGREEQFERPEALEGTTAAIHLSGATVAGRRWTESYKREIWESRVRTTRVLAEALAGLRVRPQVLITASAIGFYGDRGDEVMDEDSPAGKGFFPELCAAWEEAARAAAEAGIRVVHLRIGVVIGPKGGALDKMLPLFRLGLGGRLGSGRQWMSWVSLADVAGATLFALDGSGGTAAGNGLKPVGAVNVVAPQAVTNAEFTRELAQAVHRPAAIPVPAFALRLAFGQMADEALLASARVMPKRLLEAEYAFRHPSLAEALAVAVGQQETLA